MLKLSGLSLSLAALLLAFSFTATACASRADRIEKKVASRFAELDVDGDGQLSAEEFAKSKAATKADDPDAAFRMIDTDGSGGLSLEELTAAAEARFAR